MTVKAAVYRRPVASGSSVKGRLTRRRGEGSIRRVSLDAAALRQASAHVGVADYRYGPQAAIRIFGEPFVVERVGSRIFLRHRRWSLLGSGDSLLQAQLNLLKEAGELAEVMRGIPTEELSKEAERLYHFALRVS